MKPNRQQQSLIRRFWNEVKPAFMARNAVGDNLARLPIFNRGGRTLTRDFGYSELGKQDYYVGYLYAAIKKRAGRASTLGREHLGTRNRKNREPEEVEHPYINLIDESPSFTNNFFWVALSHFLDLKGEAFILAVRNYNAQRIGFPQEFKLLNPYNISRVVSGAGELGGYVETSGGKYRVIPEQQIIHVKTFNPFNLDSGYAMVDAARDDQFLNRQGGSFTRHAMSKNVGQRGLITTEVILEDEEFENFKNRVRSSGGIEGAGDFLFGNGPGSINYQDMQIDLDKLALEKINEVSREGLFAVGGVSKTILGIEMSGVTRESGKVQRDLFTEQEAIPQIDIIIDALNQDYRNNYNGRTDYRDVEIFVDSPLKSDHETELKEAQVVEVKAKTVKVLTDAGFEPAEVLAAVGLEDISFIGRPVPTPATPSTDPDDEPAAQGHVHHEHAPEIDVNLLDDQMRQLILARQTSLETDMINIERRLVQAAIKKVSKNDITAAQESEVINKTEKKELTAELAATLAAFYSSIIPMLASVTMRQRFKEFGRLGTFKMNSDIRRFIREHSKKSATSHIGTIVEEIYGVAKEAASKGLSQTETVQLISREFNETISKQRARTIARTETNRSVAQAQIEADRQFIQQNGLEGKAFKRWITRSDNPCPFCTKLETETNANPIPFEGDFVGLGDSISADFQGKDKNTTRTYVVGYEPINSGTLHPNCSCIYELIIKT